MFLLRVSPIRLNKYKTVFFLSSNLNKKSFSLLLSSSHLHKTLRGPNQDRNSLQAQNTAYIYTEKSSNAGQKLSLQSAEGINVQVEKNVKLSSKHEKQWQFFFELTEEQKLNLIEQLRQKESFQQLADLAKEMAFQKEKSKELWQVIEEALMALLVPTQDQNHIRIVGRLLFALEKSRLFSRNYESEMLKILPFCSNRSFAHIITTLAKMGKISREFCDFIAGEYQKRKHEFLPRELNLLNYIFAKNNMTVDPNLIKELANFPLSSIALMLKTFDQASLMSEQILRKCIPFIILRRKQTKLLDLKRIINIYTKYKYLDDERIISYLSSQYAAQARNINNEGTFLEIWKYIPQNINLNKIPYAWLENLRLTIRLLRKYGLSPQGQKILQSSISYKKATVKGMKSGNVRLCEFMRVKKNGNRL